MSYLLITGLVFIAVPVVVLFGLSLFIMINFLKDDRDAKSLFSFALGSILFGMVMVAAHYIGNAI